MQQLRVKPNRLQPLLETLQTENQLPSIYFVFGRKRAEQLADEAMHFDFVPEAESRRILSMYEDLLDRYQLFEEKSAQDLWSLVERGIAFHHAGMLPTLKEVVEQLFTSRLLKLIFTTETFALGINMPARSVIFDELQKFYGTGFRNLTTRDFYQMAGRAGRRGMDERGYVYSRIHPHHITFPEVERILYGNPEPIFSQFNATYATLLNLYRDLGRGLLDIYPRSFHYFQASKKRRCQGFQSLESKLTCLEEMSYLRPEGLTPKGEFASSLFGYELLLAEMHGEGVLDNLNEIDLCMLLSGLVFEPRKADQLPHLNSRVRKLDSTAQHYFRLIHQHEFKHKITPYTKRPHFHIAPAIEAWAQGKRFDELFRLTSADEGGLVRNFRMIIQLLRELTHASHTSETLRRTTQKALGLINRDIVDAEKQLRL